METQTRKRRRRYSERERQQLVAAWRESGASAAAFSAQSGVDKSNLWRWSRDVERDARPREKSSRRQVVSAPSSRFIELRVDRGTQKQPGAVTTAGGNTPLFEVSGPLGIRVRVYAGVDAETLSQLLGALQGGARC